LAGLRAGYESQPKDQAGKNPPPRKPGSPPFHLTISRLSCTRRIGIRFFRPWAGKSGSVGLRLHRCAWLLVGEQSSRQNRWRERAGEPVWSRGLWSAGSSAGTSAPDPKPVVALARPGNREGWAVWFRLSDGEARVRGDGRGPATQAPEPGACDSCGWRRRWRSRG